MTDTTARQVPAWLNIDAFNLRAEDVGTIRYRRRESEGRLQGEPPGQTIRRRRKALGPEELLSPHRAASARRGPVPAGKPLGQRGSAVPAPACRTAHAIHRQRSGRAEQLG